MSYEDYLERAKEYQRARRADPVKREAMNKYQREYQRKYRAANREKLQEYQRLRYADPKVKAQIEKNRQAYLARYPEVKTKRAEKQVQWRLLNIEFVLLKSARVRAARKGIAFDLEIGDITIPAVCPILGIAIASSRGVKPCSPSIDRIDPKKGYVKGNVRVISHRANALKSNADWLELLDVALDSVGIEHGHERAAQCAKAIKRILGLTTDHLSG